MTSREQQLEDALKDLALEIVQNYIGYSLYDSDERYDGPDSSDILFPVAQRILDDVGMGDGMRRLFVNQMNGIFYGHEYFAGYNGYRCWTWIDNQVVYEARDGDDLPIVYLKRDMGDLKQGTRFHIRLITQFSPEVGVVDDNDDEFRISVSHLTLQPPKED